MLKELTVVNQRVLDLYYDTESQDLVGDHTLRSRGFDPEDFHGAMEYSCSDRYLSDKLDNNDIGFRIEHSSNFLVGETPGGQNFLKRMKEILNFDDYYTSGYVPHGFVGWHSDGDIGGWYVMITYSPEQAGFFKYRDVSSGNVVTLKDQSTWMTRAVELPSDPDRVFWHCTGTTGRRFTFLLLFKEKENFQRALDTLGAENG